MDTDPEERAPADPEAGRVNDHAPRVSTLDEPFASVPPLGNEGDFKRIIREAKEERAERLVRKLTDAEPDTAP